MTIKSGLTEIRMHGRGGQGVVFSATAIAEAAHREGKHVQAFGIYGAERRGAPVTAFVRIGDQRDVPRCQVQQPDIVVSFSANLPREAVLKGLKRGGALLVNCAGESDGWKLCSGQNYSVWMVDATGLAARSGLSSVGIPVVNTVMLGALLRIGGMASLDSLLAVLQDKIPRNTEKNLLAAQLGYAEVRELECYATAL